MEYGARFIAIFLSAALIFTMPGVPAAAAALAQSSADASPAQSYEQLAQALLSRPPASAGRILEKARILKASSSNGAVSSWLGEKIEKPLRGLNPQATPGPDRLRAAREGLAELKNLLIAGGGASRPRGVPAEEGRAGINPGAEQSAERLAQALFESSQAKLADTAAFDAVHYSGEGHKLRLAAAARPLPGARPTPPPFAGADEDKLSQKSDISDPISRERSAKLRALDDMLAKYKGQGFLDSETQSPGLTESGEVKAAALETLAKMFKKFKEESEKNPAAPSSPRAETEAEKEIAAMAGKIEGLKSTVQGQVSQRDALVATLATHQKFSADALSKRRDGQDMMEFRKNFARAGMVMDLSYGLNVLNSLEKNLAGMQAMLDDKIAGINAKRTTNTAAAAAAEAERKRKDEWTRQSDADIKDDKKNATDFSSLSEKSATIGSRVGEFRGEVSGLLRTIDGRDSLSPYTSDALSEYNRRLGLLPRLQQKLKDGGGSSTGADSLNLENLKNKLEEIHDKQKELQDGIAELDKADIAVETAGVLIVKVPGPEVSVKSPGTAQILDILSKRRVHWLAEKKEQQDLVDDVDKMLGAQPQRNANDFGELVPESLRVYLSEQVSLKGDLKRELDRRSGESDELARRIKSNMGAVNLPRLSGETPSRLRDILPAYLDQLDELAFEDTDAGYSAKMDKIALSKQLPFLGDLTIRSIEAEATIKTIEKAINILEQARARFRDSVAALQVVIDDIALDEAFVRANYPVTQRQALIDRKKTLLKSILKPMLERLELFVRETLIKFQKERIEEASPSYEGDSYSVLYKEKIKLYNRIHDGLHKSLPWGLASGGAKQFSAAEATANIVKTQNTFTVDYKNKVADFLLQMKRRQDPDYVANEDKDVYGEKDVPYSLVRRKVKYQAEKAQRAAQINKAAAEVNDILKDMDKIAPAHRLFARYALPADVSADAPDSVTRLRRLADDKVLKDMAAVIKEIADAAAEASKSDPGLDVGPTKEKPSGEKEAPKVSDQAKLALLGLNAFRRIVPTPETPAGASVAEALARFLFSDALVESSNKNLIERIPKFETFLKKADGVIDLALADMDQDKIYVNGDLSQGDAVLTRKMGIYGKIRDTAREGADLFNEKAGWSAEAVDSINDVTGYYESLSEVYTSGNEALDADEKAARLFKDNLTQGQEKVRKQKEEYLGWLKQLNDPKETALARLQKNISTIQAKTKKVLEDSVKTHQVEKEYQAVNKAMETTMASLSAEQGLLKKKLEEVGDLTNLKPELAQRVWQLTNQGSSWLAAGAKGPQTLMIPKSQFGNFLSHLFGSFSADSASQDIVSLREEILKNPMALSQLLPNSKMIEMGQGTNGFYLVYQTSLSSPHGMETETQTTLGNVGRFLNNNVSIIGHRFASPPSAGNAPFGDQGVTVQTEYLGDNTVNYLNVTFHKFLQDIPGDLTVDSQRRESRMMVFDDFALMSSNGKLYFGAAGFADMALSNAAEKPYYYGGNFKSSIKFTEIMSLNAEESLLFAKDPRKFLQTVNLDFSGYDSSLKKDFIIDGRGQNKNHRRDQIGVGVDLAKKLESKESFNLDFFFSRVTGTDDLAQEAVGATILKGFSFNEDGKAPVKTSVSATGELGEQYNTLSANFNLNLPNQQIVFNAQGKMMGDAQTYYLKLAKKFGTNTDAFVSYGSQYVGLNHRLTLGTETTFTLGELWRAVAASSAESLTGGAALKTFNTSIDDFFKRDEPDNPLLKELQKVFQSDVGQKLLTMDIGTLSRELQTLQAAGAVIDNLRVRSMIGFVTNPVTLGDAERATGGGFQVGTQTELTMTKTQKKLIRDKIASIYAEALQLQVRMLELAKQWQLVLAELVEARWEMALAGFVAANAQDAVLKSDAEARFVAARGRHRQSVLRYNAITGRGPDDALPFDGLNPQDVDRLFANLEKVLNSPERLSRLLSSAGSSVAVGKSSFNLMDWIPWIEKMTFYAGVQLQDTLSNQILGAGVSIRLPFYDPSAKASGNYFVLKDEAIIKEMAGSLRSTRQRARAEIAAARAWDAQSAQHQKTASGAANAVADAIRAYRNRLMPQPELWERFRRWYWILKENLHARAMGSLQTSWAILDGASYDGWAPSDRDTDLSQPQTLAEGFDLAKKSSPDLEALANRSQAAKELMDAASHRISKVDVDVNLGLNLTASGIALIPAMGITGLGIFPILNVELKPGELRDLSVARHHGEADLYKSAGAKVSSDLSLQLYQGYISYRTGVEALSVYEKQLLPELAQKAQSGAPRDAWELDQARAQYRDLQGRQNQTLGLVNYLMGRPEGTALALGADFDSSLADLKKSFEKDKPAAARRELLASRVKIARSVRTIVDKNLAKQTLRAEPVSLIVRSLGRLISALSGNGMSTPEQIALAHNQALMAERDLEAFDKGLPAQRRKIQFELALAEGKLAELKGTDGKSRLMALALKNQIYNYKAALLSCAEDPAQWTVVETALPSSYGQLKDRLEEALAGETFMDQNIDFEGAARSEASLEVGGSFRYYDHRTSIAKEPVGKQYIEGWVEVRKRSTTTTPEALAALANLQKERSDQIYRAQQNQARAQAEMLLSQLRLHAALARGADGALSKTNQERLQKDFARLAAHLHLKDGETLEKLLKILPQEGSLGAEAAAQAYLSEVSQLDMDLIRKTLFSGGLPPGIEASADPLLQLRANLIAEKMSYKGFTPMAAFGLFRGTWVSGVFIEAPDPVKVFAGLQNILSDALRRELESQNRLKALALKLHSLMASVSDKVQLTGSLRSRLQIARRNLMGTAARYQMKMASKEELVAAQEEAVAAHGDFVSTLTALHMDFVYLVTELEALGYPAGSMVSSNPLSALEQVPSGERGMDEQLLAYWSKRLLDKNFEKNQAAHLKALSPDLRAELSKRVGEYALAVKNNDAIRHKNFTPAEKLDLLVKTDLQGRRLKVEEVLSQILKELSSADPTMKSGWGELLGFLGKDIAGQAVVAGAEVRAGADMEHTLREAYWKAVPAPAPIEAAYQKLSRLSERMAQAKQAALENYLEAKLKPEDYLLRDLALDAYVKAQIAYDEEVIRAFSLKEMTDQPRWSKALNGLFGLNESVARRRDLLKYGRGIMAVDSALVLSRARLSALRWDATDPRDLIPASETYAQLKAMRQRWIERPDEIASLYVVKETGEWLTAKNIDALSLKNRIVELGGRKFLMKTSFVGKTPENLADLRKTGAQEIVAGKDVYRDQNRAAQARSEEIRRRRENDQALAHSDFILTKDAYNKTGKVSDAITLEKFRSLERDGRVFYFNAAPDRQGLRQAVHPVAAQWRNPEDLIVMVEDGVARSGFAYGKFPTLESLQASLWKDSYKRLEMGARGVEAMIGESHRKELQARRREWLHLKLEGYAYALDKAGKIAAVYMDKKEFKDGRKKARDEKAPEHEWSFHEVSDLKLGLAQDGAVVAAESPGFSRKFGAEAPARWLTGDILTASLDGDKVASVITDRDQLEKEAAGWWIADTSGRVWKETGKNISPTLRPMRYLDASNPDKVLPVVLGRKILAERMDEAQDELGDVGRWSYMPWNWPNIILETPRGIVKTPVELIDGRDPNQEGYIGKVAMRQTEGGATVRRGWFGKFIHFIDIFELFPDKVDRYMDPSQFPKTVDHDGALLPGELEHEKSPHTADKNIHFGTGSLLREVRYAKEDREDARNRILGNARGDVRRSFSSTVRGRDGKYEEAKVEHQLGRQAVEEVLKEVGDRTDAQGQARFSVAPGHVAVDRVAADIQITLGAEHEAERAKTLEKYLQKIKERVAAAEIEAAADSSLAQNREVRLSLDQAVDMAKPGLSYPGFPAVPRLFAQLAAQ